MANPGWVGPLLLIASEVGRVPTRVSGVYLLHQYAMTTATYAVLYAGKTTDLHRRLTENLSDQKSKASIWWLRQQSMMYLSAAPVFGAERREHIEAGLILGLQPPRKDQLPTASPLFTNLPPLRLKGD